MFTMVLSTLTLCGALSLLPSSIDTAYQTNAPVILDQVVVSAPATHSEMQHISILLPDQLSKISLGQDLPALMNHSTSIVTTSDAGNAVGYAGIRIRGNSLSSIRVSLNGVAMNESESQDVYFVDTPDLLNTLGKIEIVRGNGNLFSSASSGFGGSIHLTTQDNPSKTHLELASSYGSFHTYKEALSYGTGIFNKHFSIETKLARVGSDGYIDRAFSKLQSAYLSAQYETDQLSVQMIYFGGKEKTYQAWYGIDASTLTNDRRYNPAGTMMQGDSIVGFYNNQTDNYLKQYFQTLLRFHWQGWNIRPVLYYSKGKGYFENYNNNINLLDSYGSTLFSTISNNTSNTIDQKWLDNEIMGALLRINRTYKRLAINATFDANKYVGANYGKLLWAENASLVSANPTWYSSPGYKKTMQAVLNLRYALTDKLRLYSEFQYRCINYSVQGTLENLQEVHWKQAYRFFNPGIGMAYAANKAITFSGLVGVSHREPTRSSLENADPQKLPTFETLYDLELGAKYTRASFQLSLNAYTMIYRNQLVQNGQLNSVGAYIMTNVKQSNRTGIETELDWNPLKNLNYSANLSFSRSRINDQSPLNNTTISFSPAVVASQMITYHALPELQFSWQSKYVSAQQLDNTNNPLSKLSAYNTQDIQILYTLHPVWAKQLELMGTVQNLLNKQYVSNGWTYQDASGGVEQTVVGYYPQAGIHLLVGIKIYL